MKKQIRFKLGDINAEWAKNELLVSFVQLALVLFFCWLVYFVSRKILLKIVKRITQKTAATWDDRLLEARFFAKLSVIVPVLILMGSVGSIFKPSPDWKLWAGKTTELLFVVCVGAVIIAFINAMQKHLMNKPALRDKPLNSYSQLTKILVLLILGIVAFSIVTGKTPLFFISAMGAMSAIVLLVFKDTILGFVGSIQLATNDMVRVGDWITVEKFGADGNVEEINLATIKVRNFDKTITTVPTYSLISDSFRNWRGMEESEGRRMKRAVFINISSIHFSTDEELDKFENIRLIKDYLQSKRAEINEFNASKGIEKFEVNGRRLTNIGIFRKYLENYLIQHKEINQSLTCMVRQLPPSEKGLPIEIYAFTSNKEWIAHEQILSDVFDHLLAIVPFFNLEVFQNPTGGDFRALNA